MKTLILSIVLIFGFVATNHGKPTDDIYSIKETVITEEAYVDDIPFNTWEIAVGALYDGDDAKLAEEPYVDDIPFDTRAIASQCMLQKIEKCLDEANVNDIPFNTEKVMYEALTSRLTAKYREEQNIPDFSEENEIIICKINDGHISFVTLKTTKFK
jgi:hypothetical protein